MFHAQPEKLQISVQEQLHKLGSVKLTVIPVSGSLLDFTTVLLMS